MTVAKVALLLLATTSAASALCSEWQRRTVYINGHRCDTGSGAEKCAQEYCSANAPLSDMVTTFFGGADEYATCEKCFEVACDYGGAAGAPYCPGAAVRSTCSRPKPAKTDKIAIIGGGVQGLFMARKLKKEGYSKVTVFEKESALAGSTESFQADGHTFDWSTKIIPADMTSGPGFHPELQAMFTEYGFTTRPYLPGQNYDTSLGAVLPLPKVLIPYTTTPEGQQQLVGNMIAGFELLKNVVAAGPTPEHILNAGIAMKNETWADFSIRANIPAFTSFCEFLANGFLNGPVADHSAAVVLNGRASYMPAYVKALLKGLGVTSSSPLPLSAELKAVLDNPFPGTGHVLNEGYQPFFDQLAAQEGIDVCLGCEVTSLKYWGGRVLVKAKHQLRRRFDHVIVSSRPHDSVKFMRRSRQRSLMAAASETDPVSVFMFRVDSTPAALGNPFVSFVYPGADTFSADGSITGVAKDHADSNVLAAIGYADPDASDEEAIEKAITQLDSFAMPVSEVIGYRKYSYVSGVSVPEVENDWYAKTGAQQGVRNTYVIGEVFSGYGVLPCLRFVNEFYTQHFDHGN